MKLREWVNKQVDIEVAKLGSAPSLADKVASNQAILASTIRAVEIVDMRLELIEAKLGIDLGEIIKE